jgi:hypothetical protein
MDKLQGKAIEIIIVLEGVLVCKKFNALSFDDIYVMVE